MINPTSTTELVEKYTTVALRALAKIYFTFSTEKYILFEEVMNFLSKGYNEVCRAITKLQADELILRKKKQGKVRIYPTPQGVSLYNALISLLSPYLTQNNKK